MGGQVGGRGRRGTREGSGRWAAARGAAWGCAAPAGRGAVPGTLPPPRHVFAQPGPLATPPAPAWRASRARTQARRMQAQGPQAGMQAGPTWMPMSCSRCRSRGLVRRWSSVSSRARPLTGSMKKADESPTLAACDARSAAAERRWRLRFLWRFRFCLESGGGIQMSRRPAARGGRPKAAGGPRWLPMVRRRPRSPRAGACGAPAGRRRPGRRATSAPRWLCSPLLR